MYFLPFNCFRSQITPESVKHEKSKEIAQEKLAKSRSVILELFLNYTQFAMDKNNFKVSEMVSNCITLSYSFSFQTITLRMPITTITMKIVYWMINVIRKKMTTQQQQPIQTKMMTNIAFQVMQLQLHNLKLLVWIAKTASFQALQMNHHHLLLKDLSS